MKRTTLLPITLLALLTTAPAQVKRTTIPLGNALTNALQKSTLTGGTGAEPFHIRIAISEPDNPQSPYQGTIEEWWNSPTEWHRVVTGKDGLQQTIVMTNGSKTEQDTGDYFPLWLRSFVQAAFDPVPNADAWAAAGMQIEQITMPNGAKSNPCVRSKTKIGTGDQATDAFLNLCFDGEGRLESYGSPRYSMEFHDYAKFGKRQVPRKFADNPEPGTALLGAVTTLEAMSKAKDAANLFTPLPQNDNRFQSAQVSSTQMESLSAGNAPIHWPPVHSGNIHGHLSMYVSTDANGQVREAWPLNSDNAGLQDPAREQVRHWKFKPAQDKAGNRVQVDGGLGFVFDTIIGDPLPHLTNAEVRALASNIVEPQWPPTGLHSGDAIEVEVSVDQAGKLAGSSFPKTPPAAFGPVYNAIRQWTFRPLVRDGKPQYFQGTVTFVVP